MSGTCTRCGRPLYEASKAAGLVLTKWSWRRKLTDCERPHGEECFEFAELMREHAEEVREARRLGFEEGKASR